jgi:hypothetical protein
MIYVLYRGESLQAPYGESGSGLGEGWLGPVCFKNISHRRSVGNVEIPEGFPRGVGRVESRYFGFPCFPLLVISNACLSWGLQASLRYC